MLGRTANDLYWLSRYVERAENMARLTEVGSRIVLTPREGEGYHEEWRSMLQSGGCADGYFAKFETPNTRDVVNYLLFDPDNSSSVLSCLKIARTNARAQRTAITREMWEFLNSSWIEFSNIDPKNVTSNELPRILDFVKERSALYRGAVLNTILRNDTFYFSELGTFVERADNTARILDVKYHVLLPEKERVGGQIDYFQWASILRSVSALTSYYWVYKESVKPWLVADLLIRNPQMPRSLASCYENLSRYLDDLAQFYGRQGNSQRLARAMLTKLSNTTMDDIFQGGLHEFIQQFIAENNALGNAITEQYLT